MAQAQGSLSSAAHAVEGVPLSSFQTPSRKSIAHADVPIPPIRASAPLQSRFAVRFASGPFTIFLRDYSESGLACSPDLDGAKLFERYSSASFIADFLYGEAIRVVVGTDGTIRLAILEPSVPITQISQGRPSEEKNKGKEVAGATGLPRLKDSGSPVFFLAPEGDM